MESINLDIILNIAICSLGIFVISAILGLIVGRFFTVCKNEGETEYKVTYELPEPKVEDIEPEVSEGLLPQCCSGLRRISFTKYMQDVIKQHLTVKEWEKFSAFKQRLIYIMEIPEECKNDELFKDLNGFFKGYSKFTFARCKTINNKVYLLIGLDSRERKRLLISAFNEENLIMA